VVRLYEIYLDTQLRRRTVPRLSPRELEVLELADQGLSNTGTAAAALTLPHRNRIIPPFDPETMKAQGQAQHR
jgi:hypothetical protein